MKNKNPRCQALAKESLQKCAYPALPGQASATSNFEKDQRKAKSTALLDPFILSRSRRLVRRATVDRLLNLRYLQGCPMPPRKLHQSSNQTAREVTRILLGLLVIAKIGVL